MLEGHLGIESSERGQKIFSAVPQMNSDTEETTKVSEIEVNALKETRLAAQEKFVLEKKRHRVAEKCMVPFENLNEDATAKQVFAHVTSIFAGKSMCDRF